MKTRSHVRVINAKHDQRLQVAAAPTTCRKKSMTKQHAKDVMRAMRAKGSDGELAPYRCRYCSQWHLGHPTTADKLRKRGIAV